MTPLKILKEIHNPLFNRKEVELELVSKVTPSKNEVDKLLSEKYSSTPDQIRIKKIAGKFGSTTFKITANVYATSEEMFSTERFSKKEKEKIKKAREVSTAPKEAAEEVKEEKE